MRTLCTHLMWVQGAFSFANDCTRCQAILVHDTRKIAIACIFLALERSGVDVCAPPHAIA